MIAVRHFDFCIVGSGFAGSLLARILACHGKSVLLLDREHHPRFAVGESSTPLADFLLAEIANRYHLADLVPLCRWGTWKQTYPQLTCGLKRGFSYFKHTVGREFSESDAHEASLLVAASASDDVADTHWLRSEVDEWFFNKAKNAGVETIQNCIVHRVRRLLPPVGAAYEEVGGALSGSASWQVDITAASEDSCFCCDFLIDSTGGGGVIAKHLQVPDATNRLSTRTSVLFGHFTGVGSMQAAVPRNGRNAIEPFHCDAAAQHHLLDSAWMWMLRFEPDESRSPVTSVGLVRPTMKRDCGNEASQGSPLGFIEEPGELWRQAQSLYPTLRRLLGNAKPLRQVSPAGSRSSDFSDDLKFIPAMSRMWAEAAGPDWAMLPTTAGVVDPLHSTGIAHALSGVLRLADVFVGGNNCRDGQWRDSRLQEYSESVVREIQHIDSLIYSCYLANDRSFEAFVLACHFYFVCAIQCENDMLKTGKFSNGFLLSSDERLSDLMLDFRRTLGSASGDRDAAGINSIKQRLRDWDSLGLLEPEIPNRIFRSAADK